MTASTRLGTLSDLDVERLRHDYPTDPVAALTNALRTLLGVPDGEMAALTKAADFTCDRRIRLSALDQVTLDEVAAGLTENEVHAMAQLIRRLRDELDLTVIWIEHAVTTLLQYVERVIVLHQGRKIADGTPGEVVRNAEVVEAYLGDEMVEVA